MYNFSVNYNTIDVSDIEDIHQYLTWFIRQMFIVLLLVLLCFGESFGIKCICMNDYAAWLDPHNLNELHYYPFIISMSRCNGSCNTVHDPFGRICVPFGRIIKWKR